MKNNYYSIRSPFGSSTKRRRLLRQFLPSSTSGLVITPEEVNLISRIYLGALQVYGVYNSHTNQLAMKITQEASGKTSSIYL